MSVEVTDISNIFLDATYFGVIVQFMSTFELFQSIVSINKFVHEFLYDPNNIAMKINEKNK